MKVVINTCFGGFGLSTAAVLWLIEKKSPIIGKTAVKEYCGGERKWFPSEKITKLKGGFQVGWIDDVLYKGSYVYTLKNNYEENWKIRAHPDLIAVIEELGDAITSGAHAKLKIVEIPDGIEFEIDEYDGLEHIAEKHRTWS